MSLFRPERRTSFDTSNLAELLAAERGARAWSGENVTEESAMRLAAVWACVRLLADQVSATPLHGYRLRSDLPERLPREPELLTTPSALVDAGDWRSQVMVSLLLHGNAYGIVTARDGLGWPTKIELIEPSTVDVRQERPYTPPTYRVDGVRIPNDDITHLPGRTLPGSVVGLSPITYARQSVGVGLAAGRFGAEFFGSNGHPTAIVRTEQEIDQHQAETIKQRLMAAFRNRQPAVLGSGWDFESIQVNPNDSQFLDTISASAADVCRFFGVFPEMIGVAQSGSTLTYANREQRAVDHLTYTYDPWLQKLERWVTGMLPRGQFAEFNRDYLLRTDTKSRYEAHQIALSSKFKTVNEVRRLENMPPLDGGDEVAEDSRSLSAAEVSQKVYLAVKEGVLSVEEGRRIIAEAGADIDPDDVPERQVSDDVRNVIHSVEFGAQLHSDVG